MQEFIIAAKVIIPLFFIIAFGYFLLRIHLVDEKFASMGNKLCFKVFLPVLLFYNIYTTDIRSLFDAKLILFAGCGIAAVFVLAWVFVYFFEKDNRKRGVMIQGMMRSNFVVLGMPVILNLFGENSGGLVGLLLAIVLPMYNILSVFALEYFAEKQKISEETETNKEHHPVSYTHLIWTGEWYEPTKEKAAALDLINKGCDVIAQHTNSTAPLLAAQEKGVYGIGYNAQYSDTFKDAYLTNAYLNWGAFYDDDVKAAIDGTWQSRSYWGGIETGMVGLDDLSDNCKDKEAMTQAVEDAKEKIVNGELFVFTGPLEDNEGNQVVADGQQMTDEEMLAMDWLVKGVIGSAK